MVMIMLFLAAPALRAQWTEVATNLVDPEQQHVGSIRFHGGCAWAGTYSLFSSNDSGLTWKQSVAFQDISGVTDIAIFDSLHILVSTLSDGLFITVNAGQSWTNVQPGGGFNQDNFYQVAYNGSSLVMHALDFNQGILYTSLDGGTTWNGTSVTNSNSTGSLCFAIGADKTIYVFSISDFGHGNLQGWIDGSTDLGRTWNALNGDRAVLPSHGDCFTISADSCDNQRLYLVNENVGAQSGGRNSRIDMTDNAGTSWQNVSTVAGDFYSGSLSSTPNVLYVGTVQGSQAGVIRSTDSGTTWNNISGPTEFYDTRSIAAVNDNIVLVLDDGGNVWRTLNSGGFPVQIPTEFSVSPTTLFTADTISCDSITHSVAFKRGHCSNVSVSHAAIIGADSGSFRTGTVYDDSIAVTLYGTRFGNLNAALLLQLDNGSTDTVFLAGFVNIDPSVLSMATTNVQTDTLGGTVFLPILVNGLLHSEDVELMLHYNGSMDYLGSFSLSGSKLDIPGQQGAGRSELEITGALPGDTLGYAEFNVFNDSNSPANATFDSLKVLTATSPCEYTLPASVTDTISTLSGCGIQLLSKLIHLDESPLFRVWPNPTMGTVWLTSSLNVGDVSISVYDVLGTQQSQIAATVQKDSPLEVPLPDASGVYSIVLKSPAGMRTIRVVRQR